MGDDHGWKRLATISSEEEAVLLQGRLETEGIPCSIESLKYHAEPVNFGRLSEVRLWVLEKDLDRARKLLDEMGDGAFDGEADPEEGAHAEDRAAGEPTHD